MDEKELLQHKYNNALRQLGSMSDAFFTAMAQAEMLAAKVAELEKKLAETDAEKQEGDLD